MISSAEAKSVPSSPTGATAWGRKVWVTKQELEALTQIPTAQIAAAVTLTWMALFVLLEAALSTDAIVVDSICVVGIGVLFAHIAYWVHEGSHFLLVRDHARNDLLTDLFLAGPVGMSVAHHRWQHMGHHAHLNDPAGDMDTSGWLCLRGPHLLVQAVLHLIGWHALVTIFRYRSGSADSRVASLPRRSLASRVSFLLWNAAVFALCAAHDQWLMYFVLWVMPLFSISVTITNLGNIVEHQPSSDVCDAGMVRLPALTRVVRAGPIERLLVAPVGFHFHFEHHRYPGIPAFRLPHLRHLLEQRGRFEERDIVWADGYLRTIGRLSTDRTFGVRLARAAAEVPESRSTQEMVMNNTDA